MGSPELERIEAMGASLDRSPYDGTWSASCQGPGWPGKGGTLHSHGAATPADAIALLWDRWVAAGSPGPRCYTEAEVEEIHAWCESRQAAVDRAIERGAALRHPWRPEPARVGVSHGE